MTSDTPEEGIRSHCGWLWATMWLLGFELWTVGKAVGCSYPLSHLNSPWAFFKGEVLLWKIFFHDKGPYLNISLKMNQMPRSSKIDVYLFYIWFYVCFCNGLFKYKIKIQYLKTFQTVLLSKLPEIWWYWKQRVQWSVLNKLSNCSTSRTCILSDKLYNNRYHFFS